MVTGKLGHAWVGAWVGVWVVHGVVVVLMVWVCGGGGKSACVLPGLVRLGLSIGGGLDGDGEEGFGVVS